MNFCRIILTHAIVLILHKYLIINIIRDTRRKEGRAGGRYGLGQPPMGKNKVKWHSAEIWCIDTSFFFLSRPFNGVLPHV